MLDIHKLFMREFMKSPIIIALIIPMILNRNTIIQNKFSYITLKINGPGYKNVFYEDDKTCDSFSPPNEVYINDIYQDKANYSYYFNDSKHEVKLIWNDQVLSPNCLFYKCKDINEIELSHFKFSGTNISHILSSSSCADLEKVCNQAGIYAGYKNKDKIEMEDLLRAALELKYNTSIEDNTIKDEYSLNTAYHEAGHALIGELLDPGSVSFITIKNTDSRTRGFTSFHNNKFHFEDVNHRINRIKALLGGKAATEIVYGKCDIGSKSDLRRASDIVNDLIDDYCMFGFDSLDPFGCAGNYTKDRKDMKRSGLLEKYYQEVKELLATNRNILDKLALTLDKKEILFQDEIRNIINQPNEVRGD